VSTIDPNKPVRYTKKNIDNFRNFATGYLGSGADIFTKEKTIKDKDGGDIKVFANRKPEECLGFQPGDIVYDGTYYTYVNGGLEFDGSSKISFDILSAQNVEEAMDLAFFGKDYDLPQSDNATRKGNPNPGYIKTPNANLQFNEVVGVSRSQALEAYYNALQEVGDCQWRILADAAGTAATAAPKYDDPDTAAKIDQGYQLVREFITDYENLLGTNIASLNKTQLEEAKNKLEK